MEFSSHLFWDIVQPVDWEKYSSFVITRVLLRGTLDDWRTLRKTYGLERIKNAALKARYLDLKTLGFCCAYFNIPRENFRCFIERQSIPQLWKY